MTKYSTKYIYNSGSLIGGKPVITSSGGGGSESDFRWDGRRPEEEELDNRVSAFRETSAAFVDYEI
ncbi:MAG: hypothetical protein J1E16_01295 [Muribaculaceae bacterium]|nr:hypothetical protein [Muribaculaceae bacterium]